MWTTLLTDAPAVDDGFRWEGLIVVAIVFAVVWPLQKRLRRRISDRRRARWAVDDPADRTAGRDTDAR